MCAMEDYQEAAPIKSASLSLKCTAAAAAAAGSRQEVDRGPPAAICLSRSAAPYRRRRQRTGRVLKTRDEVEFVLGTRVAACVAVCPFVRVC